MKFKHLEEITKAIAKAITDKESDVWVFVGNNSYVLDQDGLHEVIQEALEKY